MKIAVISSIAFALFGCQTGIYRSDDEERAVIEQAIEVKMDSEKENISECYYQTFLWKQRANGELVLGWIISNKGNTKAVTVLRNSFDNPVIASCVADVVSAMKFPILRKGEIIVTRFPFEFEG